MFFDEVNAKDNWLIQIFDDTVSVISKLWNLWDDLISISKFILKHPLSILVREFWGGRLRLLAVVLLDISKCQKFLLMFAIL